jgi:uncharacterized membrane protein
MLGFLMAASGVGALAGGCTPDRIEVILDEAEAVRTALLKAQPGDTVVIFYEKYDKVMDAFNRAAAEIAQSQPGFVPTGTAEAIGRSRA